MEPNAYIAGAVDVESTDEVMAGISQRIAALILKPRFAVRFLLMM